MDSPLVPFLVGCGALVFVLVSLRRALSRRSGGQFAQLEFRRRHGERVAALLDGSPDPRPGSPWIEIRIGGRVARMVAAPIGRGHMQAGIELEHHDLAMDIFHTSGQVEELRLPDGTEIEAVLDVVRRLAALGVDNVARSATGVVHVLRVRFDDVEQLPDLLRSIAPLLEELETLGRPTR